MASGCGENGGLGFAPWATVKAGAPPLRTHQLASSGLSPGHTEYLIDTHHQLFRRTPYLTHPPKPRVKNTTMYPGLIEIQQ